MLDSSEIERQVPGDDTDFSKKEKRSKHKKEKKHKRHKEKDRRRSGLSEERGETANGKAALSGSILPEGVKKGADLIDTALHAAQSPKTDAENRGSPESGEIGDKESAEEAVNSALPDDVTQSPKKRTAERREGEGNGVAKRQKIDTTAQATTGIADREQSAGDSVPRATDGQTQPDDSDLSPRANTVVDGKIRSQPSSRQPHSTSAPEEAGKSSEAKDHQGSDRPKGSSRHKDPITAEKGGDRHASRSRRSEKPRDERGSSRHRSPSRLRERGPSRTRALSRDRSRDARHRERHHRPDDRREHRNGLGSRNSRHDSRERRSDDRDRRDRDRSRRRDDSRDRRGRSTRRDREDRQEADRKRKSKEKEDKEFAAKVIAKIEENEVDEDELIEQRRRKRQELMAKLKQEKESAESVANPTASEVQRIQSPQAELDHEQPAVFASEANVPSSPKRTAPSEQARSPLASAEDKLHSPKREEEHTDTGDSETEDEQGLEVEEAQLFQQRKDGHSNAAGSESQAVSPAASSEERHKIANQEIKTAGDEFDMFSGEKVDDMFGDAPVGAPVPLLNAPKRGLLDNYDDSEGYYNFQVGEIMNDRYEVFATHGKGVFSTVLRARDRKPLDEKGNPIPVVGSTFPEVAIKVIRANDIMSKAGQIEVVILRKLAGADPSGKYHIIRLLRTFEYRNHLCLVFEPLESNLRQLTKKYGQGIGLRLDAVRSMAAQMLMALHLMKQCGVLHADIKPDNILINRGHNIVKMCDFGSAMFMGNNEITPYLVSRFYRAPEIILGLHYDHPMDVWSIGCVIYELFTGRILFPGRSNNEMLKLMMDVKGPFPKKMLKKGEFSLQHFEDDPAMSFCLMEMDPLTKRPTKRLVPNPTVKKDFRGHLAGQEGDARQVGNLIDLLEKMMHLDPDKRISAKEALRHPFIKDGRPQRQ